MTRLTSVAVAVLMLSTVGCKQEQGSLAGSWSGTVACGDAGGVSLIFEVDKADKSNEYDADGLISDLSLDGVRSDVELDSVWVQPNTSGPQVVEVDAVCQVVQEDGTYEMPCDGFDELGWDGANTLEATVGNFLESELDCDLVLTRG